MTQYIALVILLCLTLCVLGILVLFINALFEIVSIFTGWILYIDGASYQKLKTN